MWEVQEREAQVGSWCIGGVRLWAVLRMVWVVVGGTGWLVCVAVGWLAGVGGGWLQGPVCSERMAVAAVGGRRKEAGCARWV